MRLTSILVSLQLLLDQLAQTRGTAGSTGEAPPERRTIHVIFADPILVAMECVPVSSMSKMCAVACVQ